MKRIKLPKTQIIHVFTLALLCWAIVGFAQPTGLIIKDNGNVGIGTLAPAGKLDIRGENPDDGVIFILGNSDQTHQLKLFGGRQDDPNPFIMWKDGDPLRFASSAGNFSEKMRITSAGKVGIGTASPLEKLHVFGNGLFMENQAGLVIDPGSTYAGLGYRSGGTTYYNLYLKSAKAYFNGFLGVGITDPKQDLHVVDRIRVGHNGTYSNLYGEIIHEAGTSPGSGFRLNAKAGGSWADLHLQTEDITRLFIDHAGRIGIGHTVPVTKLHVDGGIDASYTTHGYMVLGDVNSINVVFDDNEILARNNGAEAPLYLNNSGGEVIIPYTMRAGYVNIGTSTGATGYRLSVNGRIMGEELRVEDSGDWPDFVLEEDYPLLSFDELENSINEMGHLPGIPSAETIAEEGILVGDMQKRMMTKIEELTLYILKLYHENAELKDRIEHLESQGNATESQF